MWISRSEGEKNNHHPPCLLFYEPYLIFLIYMLRQNWRKRIINGIQMIRVCPENLAHLLEAGLRKWKGPWAPSWGTSHRIVWASSTWKEPPPNVYSWPLSPFGVSAHISSSQKPACNFWPAPKLTQSPLRIHGELVLGPSADAQIPSMKRPRTVHTVCPPHPDSQLWDQKHCFWPRSGLNPQM